MSLKNNLISIHVAEEKINTIYNGVDIENFLFQQKKKESIYKIGILARLSKEKNHQLFVKIANVLKKRNDFMFYIAGDTRERIDYERNGKIWIAAKGEDAREYFRAA